MMVKFLFLFLIIYFSQAEFVFSQLQMKVKELKIHDITADTSMIGNEGPYIQVICSIKNNTDTIQRLQLRKIWDHESDADVIYCYNYNNRDYRLSHVDMFPELYAIIKGDTIYELPVKYYLEPHETIEICSGISIFQTTPIWSCDKPNYIYELLTILPTLKVILKGPQINLETTEIQKVSIDYKYRP